MQAKWLAEHLAHGKFPMDRSSSTSQIVVPRPAASASPGNMLEMQILNPHPRPNESETLGVGPVICGLTSCAGGADSC